jgi:hypothetical protein
VVFLPDCQLFFSILCVLICHHVVTSCSSSKVSQQTLSIRFSFLHSTTSFMHWTTSHSMGNESCGKKTIRGGSAAQFPGKLHDMLGYVEDHDIGSIIAWNRDGRSFTIHNPDNLVKIVPIFFEQTKYRSFRRQLNMWHFERILDGPNKGGFYHPFFVKGNKPLCAYMSRDAKALPRSTNPTKFLFNHQSCAHPMEPRPMKSSPIALNAHLFDVSFIHQVEQPNKVQSESMDFKSHVPAHTRLKDDNDHACFAGRNFFPLSFKNPSAQPSNAEKEKTTHDPPRCLLEARILPRHLAGRVSLLDASVKNELEGKRSSLLSKKPLKE